MSSGMTLRGQDTVRHGLSMANSIAKARGEAGLRALAERIMAGSIQRAPFLSGDLERAHSVQEETTLAFGNVIRFVISIDDTIAPYAIYMHEGFTTKDGGVHMPYKLGAGSMAKNVGTPNMGTGVGWKFLERAYRAESRNALRELRDEIAAGLA